MYRLLHPIRRKLHNRYRLVLGYILALFLTFVIAIYHRAAREHNEISSNSRLNIIRPELVFRSPQVTTKPDPPICFSNLKEAQTDYNTFDIFKSQVGKETVVPVPAVNKSAKVVKSVRDQKLKVFVLPFTHVDPGWLQTFEKYTLSTNQILTNMHQFMTKNEKMRFMWAEFVFFERWWSNQTENVRNDVRKLVEEGRLEFASGSWVMTDEANAYFPVSVDNIVEGHDFLIANFKKRPNVIWSNDPFGYSNSVPYLFRKAGIKWNVINRIHHTLKRNLQSQKAIPFQWRQYFDSDGKNDVLTQVLPYTHYDILNSCGPNQGICCEFDFKRMTHWNCPGTKPVPITAKNVEEKSKRLISELRTMSDMYQTPVLLMMHGDDFRYDMIQEWHQHHDNFIPLFEHINKGNEVEISFGTFTDYFNEMEKAAETSSVDFPTLSGDFFPYMCALNDYWTGYYTTRPFYKRQGRLLHSLIRSTDILLSQLRTKLNNQQLDNVILKMKGIRRTLSLFQHHDAITGTSKISVMDDYSELLYKSIIDSVKLIENLSGSILGSSPSLMEYPLTHEKPETMRIIVLTEKESKKEIQIFNSLPHTVEDVISLRVNSAFISIFQNDKVIESQVDPYFSDGKVDETNYQVLFRAKLAPLTFTKFEIRLETEMPKTTHVSGVYCNDTEKWTGKLKSTWKVDKIDSNTLKTEYLEIDQNEATGSIQKITTKDGEVFNLKQSWVEYTGAGGGPYLMRINNVPSPLAKSGIDYLIIRGPIRQSIHQFHGYFYQRTSIYNVEGLAGKEVDINLRVDITKKNNIELMTRFETGWNKSDTFTDSVGLQLLRREHYKLPAEANYYPMPTSAVIQEGNKRLTIVSNVEHGARFLENGTVEINIDRTMSHDDGKGLGSGSDSFLTDLKPVEMKFKILAEKLEEKEVKKSPRYSSHTLNGQRSLQRVLYPPTQFVSDDSAANSEDSLNWLQSAFPCDFQLLTIRPIRNTIEQQQLLTLFRYPVDCSESTTQLCSGNLRTSLLEIFAKLEVKRVQRTDLSGISAMGPETNVEDIPNFEVDAFDFLSLVLTV